MTPRQRSRAELVGAAVLFSTGGAALKASPLDAWEMTGFRAAIAAVAVLALVPAARRSWSWRSAVVAVAYAATAVLFVRANKLTTAASTIFLQSTSPLYIALLGPALLGERPGRRHFVYMAVLALGSTLVFVAADPPARTAPDPLAGNVMAVLSGLTVALMMMGLRWLARGATPAQSAAPVAVVMGNLMAVAVVLPLAIPLEGTRPSDWVLLGYLGVFQIGVAYALMVAGLRRVTALEATLLMFVEPVLSPLWAWLVHGEWPGPGALAGGAVILGATAVWVWLDSRRPEGS